MPRAAVYETLVLSLCNALAGAAVTMIGPFTVDAAFVALGALSWFASMFLVWWRVALRGRMRFTWPGCVAAAIGAGLLGHVVFHLLSAGVSDWNHAQTLAKTLAIPLYLAILMMGSVITYGVQTVFFGALLGILLFVWKKKARGMPRLAAPGAVR